jgi:hypothetical protein
MALGAQDWQSLATSAAEQSPDEWKILGTGAKTTIVRPGIEWRIQLVGYDPTGSSGTIFAYDAKLVRPVSRVASLTGDGGTFDGRFRPPGRRRSSTRELFNPDALSTWITTVNKLVFDKFPTLAENLDFMETRNALHPFSQLALQSLVGTRILLGTRTVPEMLTDIDLILAEPLNPALKPGHVLMDYEQRVREYFRDLVEIVKTENRDATLDFMNQTRLRTLSEAFNIPSELIIDPPVYPTTPPTT